MDGPLSFAAIQEKIETHSIKRIEDLLPLLPEQYRSRFSLIYKSESAQGASLARPRVILFGDSGSKEMPKWPQLIMAFTGDSKQRGGQILETIEYSRKSKGFVFRSVDFSGSQPVIHENPAQCMSCHSKSLHPNWDTYGLWPGAFAGQHLGHDGGFKYYPENEVRAMKRFLSHAAKHERYKHLVFSSPRSAKDYFKTLEELDGHNVRLSGLISTYNFERILSEIVSAREFLKYKDAFEAALAHSDEFFSHLPNSDSVQRLYTKRLVDTREKVEAYYQERHDRYLKNTGMKPAPNQIPFDLGATELQIVAKLRILAEDYLHIPTSDWAATRFPNTYAFTGPQYRIRSLGDTWHARKEEFLSIHQTKACSKAVVDSVSGLF